MVFLEDIKEIALMQLPHKAVALGSASSAYFHASVGASWTRWLPDYGIIGVVTIK